MHWSCRRRSLGRESCSQEYFHLLPVPSHQGLSTLLSDHGAASFQVSAFSTQAMSAFSTQVFSATLVFFKAARSKFASC
eukprot:m.291706 g.291706  ORF g.291706 m.291706 type:complete len:79 (-) comp19984_c0_seq2:942-1178(-)